MNGLERVDVVGLLGEATKPLLAVARAQVLRFAELPEAPEILTELAPKQRGHKSKHRYTLEQYGLNEARVRADLAPLYKAFPEL